jgi:hypothetical protein
MRSSLRRRLERLARSRRSAPQLSVAFVDANGMVLDDGSAVCGRWVGRHYSDLRGPVKVIRGIDPLRMFAEDPSGGATDVPT